MDAERAAETAGVVAGVESVEGGNVEISVSRQRPQPPSR